MKRLTIDYGGVWTPEATCNSDRHSGTVVCVGCSTMCENRGCDCDGCPIQKCFDKLAAYEDTGLEPEEVERLKAEREWVPVKERLPEPGIYLISCDDIDYPVKRMRLKNGCFYDRYGIYDGEVFAWMPLPGIIKGGGIR